MNFAWIPSAILCGLLAAGCAGPTQPVMKTQTRDATRSQCRRDCDDAKAACSQRKRVQPPERQEVDGPAEVSMGEWEKLYRQAQKQAKACEKTHQGCVNRCFD